MPPTRQEYISQKLMRMQQIVVVGVYCKWQNEIDTALFKTNV